MGRSGWMGRSENPLARVVGRVPVKVRTKLLVAFTGIAVLLVAVALLGLRVLGQSNARVDSLGTLQRRAATYQSLQTQSQQLRQLLALRVADDPGLRRYVGGTGPIAPAARWKLVDSAIVATGSQLGPATNESRFGFVPPPEDKVLLAAIRRDHQQLLAAMKRVIALDGAAASSEVTKPVLTAAIDADNDLGRLTDRLAERTRAQTSALVAQNRASYQSSRNLFVGVGAVSILLAVLLGYVLSWSVIRPIQRTEERLAEIALGDFSRHVEVSNRDELGTLAVNLNHMNDELRRLYGELEAASRHKSEFLANMSHELRTPLNAIIGFSELLHEQIYGELNEHQIGYVDDVLESGQHLLALINDVLDLSKVEAGKMELEISDVSLRDVFHTALTMHAGAAEREAMELELNLDPDDLTIRADDRRLRQVVYNLVSNAVKFTPTGGRVVICARLSQGTVKVSVSDTGPGIAPEDLTIIFEEFRQGRADRTRRDAGTGLGLSLSRRIIELHGGQLWAESSASGSVFWFTLPVEPPR